MQTYATLDGMTVLLVEDESMVSMLAEDLLLDAGSNVLLAMRLQEALDLARTAKFDFAVLDVNLGGGDTSYPVADLLVERKIPFMFATGYDADGIDGRYAHCPRVQKPYAPDALLQLASDLVRSVPTTSPLAPSGFGSKADPTLAALGRKRT